MLDLDCAWAPGRIEDVTGSESVGRRAGSSTFYAMIVTWTDIAIVQLRLIAGVRQTLWVLDLEVVDFSHPWSSLSDA